MKVTIEFDNDASLDDVTEALTGATAWNHLRTLDNWLGSRLRADSFSSSERHIYQAVRDRLRQIVGEDSL